MFQQPTKYDQMHKKIHNYFETLSKVFCIYTGLFKFASLILKFQWAFTTSYFINNIVVINMR